MLHWNGIFSIPFSSWTHFRSLHTPVTKHILSCSPFAQSLYSLLTHHPAWLDYMYVLCIVEHSGLCSRGHHHCVSFCGVPFCFVFSVLFFFCLLAFLLLINCAFMHLDPDVCFSSVPLNRTMTESSQQT